MQENPCKKILYLKSNLSLDAMHEQVLIHSDLAKTLRDSSTFTATSMLQYLTTIAEHRGNDISSDKITRIIIQLHKGTLAEIINMYKTFDDFTQHVFSNVCRGNFNHNLHIIFIESNQGSVKDSILPEYPPKSIKRSVTAALASTLIVPVGYGLYKYRQNIISSITSLLNWINQPNIIEMIVSIGMTTLVCYLCYFTFREYYDVYIKRSAKRMQLLPVYSIVVYLSVLGTLVYAWGVSFGIAAIIATIATSLVSAPHLSTYWSDDD